MKITVCGLENECLVLLQFDTTHSNLATFTQ